MRFLVDEALQDAVADRLAEAGHDATHVRRLGLGGSTDETITWLAVEEERVLVTTDTDFGTILALTGAAGPSVLLLRGVDDDIEARASALLEALTATGEDLDAGAVVVVQPDRYRIRSLPIE